MTLDPSRAFARAIRGAWQCRLWSSRRARRPRRRLDRSFGWRLVCILALCLVIALSIYAAWAQFIVPRPILHLSDVREAPGCE